MFEHSAAPKRPQLPNVPASKG